MAKKKSQTKTGARNDASSEELSFEDALARLEELVERLEEGDVPLEESLGAYKEGTVLVKQCLARLARAETVIKELSETADGFRLEASAIEDDDEEESPSGQDELGF
jgi:exodeoxyribonuclease VII small subunit